MKRTAPVPSRSPARDNPPARFDSMHARLEAISAAIDLERVYLWGEGLFSRCQIADSMRCLSPGMLEDRIPGSRAKVKDLLYFIAETTEHPPVREMAEKLLGR